MKLVKFSPAWSMVLSIVALVLVSVSTASAQTEKVLHAFGAGTDGAYPFDTPIFDANGNMYGTTWEGGNTNHGTVFEMSPDGKGGWNEAVLYNFQGRPTDGGKVSGGVILDAAGNLYGTSRYGGSEACSGACGTVFELSNSGGTWTETILYLFTGGADGFHPFGGLTMDAAGNLYGMTHDGGSKGRGTVFKLSLNNGTWTKTILFNFGGSAGEFPVSTLTLDSLGNLYGTASAGGVKNGGLVFELTKTAKGNWKEIVLHNFIGGADGSEPSANVIFDTAGNLYTTTFYGGGGGCPAGCGTIVELSLSGSTWTETIIQKFTQDATGYHLNSGVVIDSTGTIIYGTTRDGGDLNVCNATGCGSVFKMTLSGGIWTRTQLYAFRGFPADGSVPFSGVTLNNGVLYGTTVFGGKNHPGTLYEVIP